MTIENTMTKTVNFYILPDSDLDNRHFFAYRLVEKALEQQLPTLVLAADNAHVQVLDRLLWTARPERFVAHDVCYLNEQRSITSSIVITDSVSTLVKTDFQPYVVIDLGYDGTPLDFPKVMLVANQHAEILANARMKYQAYVNQGIRPATHKISAKQLALS